MIGKLTFKVMRHSSNANKMPQYPGYLHLSSTHSPDLNMHLHQLQHQSTKARIYHFQNQDDENAFASIVKTFAHNDKGCPHILQHLACCGSQKYPIRDPFFNMIKRSVNTYMNAWTGQDFTSYPFSSANSKDWQNLYQVYLDMSLKPLLNELDFRQEGWRYELNAEGKRDIKGIVFNQMKGSYQHSQREIITQINSCLFRGTPYAYDTGGVPQDIINLQYAELKTMYEYYYHPSNMSFYFYGNNKIGDSLAYLQSNYLTKYSNLSHKYAQTAVTPLPVIQRYKTIISMNAQSNSVAINFYLGNLDAITSVDVFCLRIISYVLLEKSNALVYRRFVQSGKAHTLGFSGFNQSKISSFSVSLKGIYQQYQCKQFQRQFQQMLNELVNSGLQKGKIQQYVHKFQVNLLTPRENNGIRVLQQTLNNMNHRINMSLYLQPREYLQKAVQLLNTKQGLQHIITKYFINNQHRVTVRQLLGQKLQDKVELKSKIMIDDSVIKQQQEQLAMRQNLTQDASVLPMLQLEDIIKPNRRTHRLVSQQIKHNKHYTRHHITINENINFYRLVFNFKQVSSQFMKGLSLWLHTINRTISTNSYTYRQMTAKIANHLAGFNVLTSLGGQDDFNVIFQFSCLKKNCQLAFTLIQQIVLSPKYVKDHTLNGYKAYINQVTENIVEGPMMECMDEAGSRFSVGGAISNNYQRIKEGLTLARDQNIESLYHTSLELSKCCHIKLIEHSNDIGPVMPVVAKLMLIEGKQMQPFTFMSSFEDKAVIYSYMVNFCSQQYRAPGYLSTEHAYMNLLLEILQQDYLHPLIREKGGAYGSSAKVRYNSTISLSSYMDPNSSKTFQNFDLSVNQILALDSINQQKMMEAKIKQFGEVDRVRIPQNEALSQLLRGYDATQLQSFRQALKYAKFSDVIETGRKYLSSGKSRCLFGKQVPQGFVRENLKDFII